MMWIPFISLAIGIGVGLKNHTPRVLKLSEIVTNLALILLMLTIGGTIGMDKSLISNLGRIGVNCMMIAFLAIVCSVLVMVILEKALLPLGAMQKSLYEENLKSQTMTEELEKGEGVEKERISALIWIMPGSIGLGILVGFFLLPETFSTVLGYSLTISLVILYVSVGIGLAANLSVFQYIKLLGWRLLLISFAVLVGSVIAGFVSSFLLSIPAQVSVLSASGMSYYSITGAYMTQVYGIEAGTYGFMVNVFREMLTVVLLPILIKISKGSPIVSGAAGCMDTMLVPITKFVGAELGLVALITGTILTFSVPFLLPLLSNFL